MVNPDLFGTDGRIAAVRLEPKYSLEQPNGAGCGYGCCNGSATANLTRLFEASFKSQSPEMEKLLLDFETEAFAGARAGDGS